MINKKINVNNINTKEISVNIELNPMDLAVEFCEMNEDEQAEFFNLIAKLSKEWDVPFIFQLQYITDSDVLNSDGRKVMASIGEYSSADA